MSATVEVRVLHCGTGYLQKRLLFADATPENGDDLVLLPIYAFYIYHPGKNIRALWDLGILKDNSKQPPSQKYLIDNILKPNVPEDAADILTRNGVSPSEINYILFSHAHIDHTGEVSLFPNATVIHGPGAQAYCRPGYPVDPDAKFLEETFPEGRTRELVDEDYTTSVGPWPKAYDIFGDRSVLLIQAAGHFPGHMVALVKTETGRVLLGGDSCHHCQHLSTFEKGGNMSYNMHLDEDNARLNLQRIDSFLKENKDAKLCLAHVGEYNSNFEKL